jgi:hypothetical protein
LFFFIFGPFCITQRRRQLCLRRIRERRWIEDDQRNHEWYEAVHSRRQERARQLQAEQRAMQMSKTQEDSMREAFLLDIMKNYSITLSESGIIDGEEAKLKTMDEPENTNTEEMGSSNFPIDEESQTDVVEAPPSTRSCLSYNENTLVDGLDFQDSNTVVCIPLAGNDFSTKDEKSRFVANGCTVCLSLFSPGEKVVWSSNRDCSHTFHHDCLVHWFMTVGRKDLAKRQRDNPAMTKDEIVKSLRDFPMLCPCCRQPSYPKTEQEENT